MENKEITLGSKFISGKIVSLDDEETRELEKMIQSLKQMERNVKESIVSKMK